MHDQRNEKSGNGAKTMNAIAIVGDPSILTREQFNELRALMMDLVQADNPDADLPIEDIHNFRKVVESGDRAAPIEGHIVTFSTPQSAEGLRRLKDELYGRRRD